MTGAKRIAENTYLITCKICGKKEAWYGRLEKYRYTLKQYHRTTAGNHNKKKAYCCSWSCYIKGLLESTAEKQVLEAQDVLLLLRFRKSVEWERVSDMAWKQLPSREYLEDEKCCLI